MSENTNNRERETYQDTGRDRLELSERALNMVDLQSPTVNVINTSDPAPESDDFDA